MSTPTCNTCRFWRLIRSGGADGICRRHAPRPTILVEGKGTDLVWPATKVDEWCGEHEEPRSSITIVPAETLPPRTPQ